MHDDAAIVFEQDEAVADRPADALPEGYVRDAKGNLIAEKNVKPADLLIDQTVRTITKHADELSAQIGRFKGHTHDDIEELTSLLAAEYGVTRSRSPKGDITLTSFDGLLKVVQRSQDQLEFGPELQIAKELLDELIGEWGEGATDELNTLVHSAFDTSKTGRINRDAVFRLRRLEFSHPKWPDVQRAITDSIRSLGTKSYTRIYRRPSTDAGWEIIPINLANA